MNTIDREAVTLLSAHLTVAENALGIILGCHDARGSVSLVYSHAEAEALCRDLAQRLGFFLATP
jgi:hypothetical protein